MNTLGLKDDDGIKVEVISEYKKKTLGLFGGSMAQVKASIELPDPKPEKKEKPAKKAEPKKEAANAIYPMTSNDFSQNPLIKKMLNKQSA